MPMTELQIRTLVAQLLGEIDDVLFDRERRRAVMAEFQTALALPESTARTALVSALGKEPAVRRWVGRQLSSKRSVIRAVPGLERASLPVLGQHVVCPEGDYDLVLASEDTSPARCPTHGTRLVPVSVS
jgi:hypothetical protein